MAAKVIPATSKDVRNWYAKPKNRNGLPEKAHKSIETSCKGRVNTDAIKKFNAHSHEHGMKYAEGQEPVVALTYKAKNHRQVTVHLPRSEVRALAGKPNGKGPLSKADLTFAGEVYASKK